MFASAKPENFTTGLILLSELLPIPLPVHSLQGLSDTEIAKVQFTDLFRCSYLNAYFFGNIIYSKDRFVR